MRLARYIGSDLVVLVLVCYASLLVFFSVFELAEFMRIVSQAGKPTSLAWELTAWNLLVISNDVGPLSVLVAVTLQGASLARRGEIVAMAAAGISPRTVLLPIAIASAAFAAAFFVIADWATPIAATHVERIMAGELGRASTEAYFSRHRQWFHTADGFVRVGSIDTRAQTYFDLSITELDHGRVRRRTTAERVVARGEELLASQVTVERYPDDDRGNLELTSVAEMVLPLERGFNLFLDLFSRPQNMHMAELRSVFELRARHGYDPRLYQNEYWGRLTAPLATLALTLLGASIAFAIRPRRSPLWPLVELLGITLLAFAARQGFRALATNGALPTPLAALAPAFTFFALAYYRQRRVR